MRLFGSERIMGVFNALGVQEGEQIEHKMLSKAIESAQKKIEGNNYGIRENLLKYDEVMNEQREIIYAERRRVLDGDSMRDVIMKMATDLTVSAVNRVIGEDQAPGDWNLAELNLELRSIIPMDEIRLEDFAPDEAAMKTMTRAKFTDMLKERTVAVYEKKEAEFPDEEKIRELERVVLLKTIDRKWMDHIDDMEQLRQGIGLQAYAQRDPLNEYKLAGYDMFNAMMASIREDTVKLLLHAKIEVPAEREQVAKVTGTNKDDSAAQEPLRRKAPKIQPNDPCPCGSGKKYKQCCGRFAE